MERRKEVKANCRLQSHLLRIMWLAEARLAINWDQQWSKQYYEKYDFYLSVADLLGGVRAKPLFRHSTIIPAWNDKTETTTIAKQLRVAISSFCKPESIPVSFVRENVIGHAMRLTLITQAFVLCVRPGHAMLTDHTTFVLCTTLRARNLKTQLHFSS